MDMNWKDLAPVVGASSPLIGKLLSIGISFIPGIGPIAGPIIGPAVGNIIAQQFGVPATPAAISAAIASNPDEVTKAKLAAATDQIKAQYSWAAAVEAGQIELQEVQIQQVNETARAELVVESGFKTWWRPANGWVLAAENAALGLCLVVALAISMDGNTKPLEAMQGAWPLILAILGLPAAVVGVTVWGRSSEKIEAIKAPAALPSSTSAPSIAIKSATTTKK